MILDKKYYKVDSLTLMAGAPIAVNEYESIINQPKIKDIALLGEKKFFEYLLIFQIEKQSFLTSIIKNKSPEESIKLTNFFYDKPEEEIILLVIFNDLNIRFQVETIFMMIFSNLNNINFFEDHILLLFEDGHQSIINSNNFYIIKDIINQIFLNTDSKDGYNPVEGTAQIIAKKLEERKKLLNKIKNESSEIKDVLANYISTLTIGSNNFSLEDVLNMTLFQVYVLIKKYSFYSQYQMQMQAMMAGASDIELIDWIQQN